jgi:hypothetical protein
MSLGNRQATCDVATRGPKWPILNLGMLMSDNVIAGINLRAMVRSISL